MEDKQRGAGKKEPTYEDQVKVGNKILDLLGESTSNPGEAFVLLQQLAIFVWDQYKVDWSNREGQNVADNRKQRCLDFISDLIDNRLAFESSTENNPKEAG